MLLGYFSKPKTIRPKINVEPREDTSKLRCLRCYSVQEVDLKSLLEELRSSQDEILVRRCQNPSCLKDLKFSLDSGQGLTCRPLVQGYNLIMDAPEIAKA